MKATHGSIVVFVYRSACYCVSLYWIIFDFHSLYFVGRVFFPLIPSSIANLRQMLFTIKQFKTKYSSLLGPFFGGMRFAGNVTTESFRSLAFETMLQNALTGLDLGGARGGSDFSPVGKSEIEIRNFCQSFSRECVALFGMGSMGTCADIPIGDLGVYVFFHYY